MKEDTVNPVKALRTALGMSQVDFAVALEISVQSVQSYERGTRLSEVAIEKMQKLAADRHLVEEGFALRGLPGLSRVVQKGDKLRLRRKPTGHDMSDSLHESLDFILENADGETVAAVEALIQLVRRNVGGKKK